MMGVGQKAWSTEEAALATALPPEWSSSSPKGAGHRPGILAASHSLVPFLHVISTCTCRENYNL